MATKTIGLDLGQTEVRAWLLEVSFSKRESVDVLSQAVHQGQDEPLLTAQLRAAFELLDQRGLLHESYAIALPRSLTSVLRHKLPVTQLKMVDEILPGELEDILPFDHDDLFYDYQIIHQDESELELLVVYTYRHEFDEFMTLCEQSGLDPKVLTLGGIYNHNLIASDDDHALSVLLDMGASGSEWIIYRGRQLVHIQRGDVGGAAVTQALADAFKVDYETAEVGKLSEAKWTSPQELAQLDEQGQRLAQTINQTIERGLRPLLSDLGRSLAHCEAEQQGSVKELQLVGEASVLMGVHDLLSTQLQTTVKPLILPRELVALSDRKGYSAQRSFLAYSMAQGLAQRLYTKTINLRRGDYAYAGDSGVIRNLMIAVVFTLLAVVSLKGAELYLKGVNAETELATLQAEVDEFGERLLGKTGLELDTLKLKVTSAKELKILIPETSALDALGELSKYIDKEVVVELDRVSINLRPGSRGSLELQGKTKTVGDVSAVIAAVEQTSCFSERVKKEKVTKSVDERTSFRVTASSTCK